MQHYQPISHTNIYIPHTPMNLFIRQIFYIHVGHVWMASSVSQYMDYVTEYMELKISLEPDKLGS